MLNKPQSPCPPPPPLHTYTQSEACVHRPTHLSIRSRPAAANPRLLQSPPFAEGQQKISHAWFDSGGFFSLSISEVKRKKGAVGMSTEFLVRCDGPVLFLCLSGHMFGRVRVITGDGRVRETDVV